jgi:CRISPR-associated protein Csb1
MTASLADRLLEAVMPARVHTAVVVRAVYQPVGGAERTVMPPTYPVSSGERDPNARYLIDSRLVPVFAHGISLREPAGSADIGLEEVE